MKEKETIIKNQILRIRLEAARMFIALFQIADAFKIMNEVEGENKNERN